ASAAEMALLFREYRAHPRWHTRFDHRGLFALAKLRVTERDLMLAGGYDQIGERGLADGPALNPDLRPRLRVDAPATVRRLYFHRDDFAGLDGHGLPRSIADGGIDEIELVHAGGSDDRTVNTRPEYALAFEYLHLNWRRQTKASGALAQCRSSKRGRR